MSDEIHDLDREFEGLEVSLNTLLHGTENNLFHKTLMDVHKQASPELLDSLKAQINKIRTQYPVSHVNQCMTALEKSPRILDVLVVCYMLNGGIFLKHEEEEDIELDESFLSSLDWNQFKEKLEK